MDDYGLTPKGRKRTKPQMVHVNVRLPEWALEFYKQQPNYTGYIRKVLVAHAQENKEQTPLD